MSDNQKLLIQFALRHLKSNMDEMTNEIINSFWEGDELNDSQIEDQIDRCIAHFSGFGEII